MRNETRREVTGPCRPGRSLRQLGREGNRRSAPPQRPPSPSPFPLPPPPRASGEEEAPGGLLAAAARGIPQWPAQGGGEQWVGPGLPGHARGGRGPSPAKRWRGRVRERGLCPQGPGSLSAGPAFPFSLQFFEQGRSWSSLSLSLFICKVGCY